MLTSSIPVILHRERLIKYMAHIIKLKRGTKSFVIFRRNEQSVGLASVRSKKGPDYLKMHPVLMDCLFLWK